MVIKSKQRQRHKTYIKNWDKEPSKKDDSDTNVGSRPPRGGKRRATEGSDLTPVKGQDAHGHAVGDTEHLIDLDVVGRDPTHPREAGQGREQVSWKEI